MIPASGTPTSGTPAPAAPAPAEATPRAPANQTPADPTPADPTPAPTAAATWPLVSVVLPTRGRPELVRESVVAVVAQRYPGEVECFVVHDQEPVAAELAELGRPGRSVTVVQNAGTPGLAGARNFGLGLVDGDFVASCDDDDVWHPTKVHKQVRRFQDDPDLIVLGSGIRLLLPGGRTAEWAGRADRISYQMLLRNRVKELHSSTLMMRRDAFAKAGRYDEELPNGYAEDYDFVLRAARVGPVGVVREPLADIRKDGQSYYRGRAEGTSAALAVFLAKHPDVARDRRGHARLLGQLAFARSCLGRRGEALRLALRALARWPFSPHPYVALLHLTTRAEPSSIARLARRFGRGMA
jgi:GT2 family glycosyltransferase